MKIVCLLFTLAISTKNYCVFKHTLGGKNNDLFHLSAFSIAKQYSYNYYYCHYTLTCEKSQFPSSPQLSKKSNSKILKDMPNAYFIIVFMHAKYHFMLRFRGSPIDLHAL